MEFTHKLISNLGNGFEVGTPVAILSSLNFSGYQVSTITNGELVKMCFESQIKEIKNETIN